MLMKIRSNGGLMIIIGLMMDNGNNKAIDINNVRKLDGGRTIIWWWRLRIEICANDDGTS